MTRKKLTEVELKLLNSKEGLIRLLSDEKLDLRKALKEIKHDKEFHIKLIELIKLQNWVIKRDKKVVILFEGRDVAGKGGAIRRITEFINPRHFRTVALHIPTKDERKQWFFQRYINQLPKPGEMVFFDRSWYNRAVVEPVNKFCTEVEYKRFMSHVNDFERMLIQSDTYLIKFYFSITKAEQFNRFKEMKNHPLKRWKITAVDKKAQLLWDVYTSYEKKMFKVTNTELSPWKRINANDVLKARLEAITHILDTIPYK